MNAERFVVVYRNTKGDVVDHILYVDRQRAERRLETLLGRELISSAVVRRVEIPFCLEVKS